MVSVEHSPNCGNGGINFPVRKCLFLNFVFFPLNNKDRQYVEFSSNRPKTEAGTPTYLHP